MSSIFMIFKYTGSGLHPIGSSYCLEEAKQMALDYTNEYARLNSILYPAVICESKPGTIGCKQVWSNVTD